MFFFSVEVLLNCPGFYYSVHCTRIKKKKELLTHKINFTGQRLQWISQAEEKEEEEEEEEEDGEEEEEKEEEKEEEEEEEVLCCFCL